MKLKITRTLRQFILVVLITNVLTIAKVNAQNNFITGTAGPNTDQSSTYSKPVDNIINMVIYPRPAHDIVNVQAQVNIASNVNMTVMDILGRVIIERTELLPVGPFNYKLDLSHLPNGMYILEIRCGDQVLSTKLIKY